MSKIIYYSSALSFCFLLKQIGPSRDKVTTFLFLLTPSNNCSKRDSMFYAQWARLLSLAKQISSRRRENRENNFVTEHFKDTRFSKAAHGCTSHDIYCYTYYAVQFQNGNATSYTASNRCQWLLTFISFQL